MFQMFAKFLFLVSKYHFSASLLNAGGYSTLLNTPVVLRGLNEIVDRYDIFLLDQFGVLHNGITGLQGVENTLNQLKLKKKISVVLSNTSSRSNEAKRRYEKLGLVDNHVAFVTSGELAWKYIEENFYGKKCVWIARSNYKTDDFLSSLNVEIADIQDADFLLFHGTETIASKSTDYNEPILDLYTTGVIDEKLNIILKTAIEKKIPAICANVDYKVVHKNNKIAYMPGVLMDEYARLGGEIIAFGKPSEDFFNIAIEQATQNFFAKNNDLKSSLMQKTKKLKIIHIGDSIHHDIKGFYILLLLLLLF
jgi:HAD superfamily hydrolase (TIGR01459 family)